MTAENSRESSCECKIGRKVDKYDLTNLDQKISVRRNDGMSLRDLADLVNIRITEAAINAADADIAGDATSVYGAINENGAIERRVQLQDQLAAVGIEIDELEADHVSYQTVRHHLRNCLEMDTSRQGIESVAEGREVVNWARNRDREIIKRTLNRLQRVGELEAGDLNVTLTVTVECKNCGDSTHVETLLKNGTCECRGER